MSWVRPDVTSPSYWYFMAYTMAKKFQKFVSDGYVDIKEIPAGVLQDAKNFFSLTLDGKGKNGKSPKNPEESANVDAIATHVMPQIPPTLHQLDLKLKHYADFVGKIGKRHRLEKEEAETARELLRFFTNLKRFGERIRLLERVHGKDYWPKHSIRHLAWQKMHLINANAS